MENILAKYVDAKARVKYLEHSIKKTEEKIERLETTDYGYVSDVVACGKKRRKPLKTVKVTGYNIDADRKLHGTLMTNRVLLRTQEEKLLELLSKVEEFIVNVDNLELQNILTLYYIEDCTWQQVANRMNELYKNRNYTENACRKKHDRFLQKNL